MSTAPVPARPVGLWLALFGLIAAWSAWRPHDGPTWAMETAPAFLGLLLLAASWRRFRFTPLAYWLLLAHAAILFTGGHYTYAKVPAFDALRDLLGTARNDFDKLGHFAQGFVPAVIARELIVRRALVRGTGWARFFTVAVCLAISAAYELIEWAAAVALGSGADEFLGTQGDPWDTQKDMATALLGALLAVTLLAPLHDRQIARVRAAEG